MSKKTPKTDGNGTVLTMDKPADSPDSPPELAGIQTDTAAAQPLTPKRNKNEGFFADLRKIALADWGSRYYLYLYRTEPVIDRLRSGETKYVMRYSEPVDEQKLMVEHGSGRYRLNLVLLKPNSTQNNEIARYECDILNTAYPPKIPKGEWTDDPRNKKWAWAKEPEAPPAPAVVAASAAGNVLEAMRAVSDIRRDVREEMVPQPGTTPDNPVATALSMAKDLLQMRADNPMVDILRDQMNGLRIEMKEERDRGRELQDKLMQGKQGGTASGVDTAIEFMNKLQPLIDKFGPKLTEAAVNVVGRASRPRPLEQMIDIGLPILGDVLKPFANLIAMKMAAAPQPANGAYPAPAVPTTIQQPPQPGIAAPPAQPPRLIQFFQQPIVMGAFQSHFKDYLETGGGEDGTDGSDFAYWIYKAVGEGPLTDARAMGTTAILNMFKAVPQWAAIQQHETKLTAFIDEILGWKPEAMEPEEEPQAVDLTQTT